MKKAYLLILVTIGVFTYTQSKAQYAIALQGTTKLLLEDFEGEPLYGGGIRGEIFPYGNVTICAGFNYFMGISVESFTRLEATRKEVNPNFFLADLTTFHDRMNFDAKTKLFPFGMEYDDAIAGYTTLGMSLDYISIKNDVGAYNRIDYRFANTANGVTTEPKSDESTLGLYFNIGAGGQIEVGDITFFAEASYALLGVQFNAEDKQHVPLRNVNGNIGVSYRFKKRGR